MTFSLLALDSETGALAGAAATGNLCVGGWVLRAWAGVGVSASQGHYPSTLWGETVLDLMAKGCDAAKAVSGTVDPDPGRAGRQLLALSQNGSASVFSGDQNLAVIEEETRPGICAAGNMLGKEGVPAAMIEAFGAAQAPLARRLLAALTAGAAAGGDSRGLMSAAILIVCTDHPPIDLRIDHATDPLAALESLLKLTEAEAYREWMEALPSISVPNAPS